MSDYIEMQDRIIEEFESDAEEAALERFESLLDETADALAPSQSGLRAKLALYPEGDFPVSALSQYQSSAWRFEGSEKTIYFRSDIPGLNELKRALTYQYIPAFTPYARIKSFMSTYQHASQFRLIEIYLLTPNRLTGLPGHLAMITNRMINRALDDAKASTMSSHYLQLFMMMRTWAALSVQKLLPEEMCLPASAQSVDTRERSRDVQDVFAGSIQSWIPFSENELEKLVNHSLFWIQKAMPRLLEARTFLIDSGISEFHKGVVRRAKRQIDIEEALTIEIDGIQVLTVNRKDGMNSGRPSFTYRWVSEFGHAIDEVRNAVFVFVALVTGMRKSELGILSFDDIREGESGIFWVDMTRFKTSNDPNHNGEKEELPLPSFVGKLLMKFKVLRSFWSYYKKGLVFQNAFANIAVGDGNTFNVTAITSALEQPCGVDRIHAHRFRKTIAEILINRSERNIDLIRMLFGHHSYKMTLQYISRNPYMVRAVAQALEESYSKEFHEIVTAVRDGSFSGQPAERLANQMIKRPEEFRGKRLKTSILVYIAHLLNSGTPLFVGRTAVGTYCVTGNDLDRSSPPPCLHGRPLPEGRIFPDPSNCQIECRNAVVVAKAEKSLAENVQFYESLLASGGEVLPPKTRRKIMARIEAHKAHLVNLRDKGPKEAAALLGLAALIPMVEVA
ncbi:tyrosine-type recombinase/integrase [Pseudomonas sp. NPDC087358]|uniref:tyrosine-type recombinase/integrase n=1 Tax=Pseudomonas sp. NPDC087358 TaxID=3364439 RepID=UPI00384C04A6